jgi:hypothetical protein
MSNRNSPIKMRIMYSTHAFDTVAVQRSVENCKRMKFIKIIEKYKRSFINKFAKPTVKTAIMQENVHKTRATLSLQRNKKF